MSRGRHRQDWIALALLAFAAVCGCRESAQPPAPTPSPGHLSPAQTAAVAGWVRLDDRQDHTGIRVYCPGTPKIIFTDRDGLFLMPGFEPERPYEIWAQFDGYQQQQLTTFTLTPNDLTARPLELGEFVLTPAAPPVKMNRSIYGSISGLVRLAGERRHGDVTIVSPNHPLLRLSTHPNGGYWCQIEEGEYKLQFFKEGYTSGTLKARVTADRDLELPEVVLSRLPEPPETRRAVAGRVSFSDLPNPSAEQFQTVAVGIENSPIAVAATETGDFEIAGLKPGIYVLVAWLDNEWLAAPQRIDVRTADLAGLIVTLARAPEEQQAKGVVSGAVDLSDHPQNLQGIFVGLAGSSLTAITDRFGRYAMRNVPAGTYNAIFTADGYEPQDLPGIVVEAKKETALERVTLIKRVVRPKVILTDPADRQRSVLLDVVTPVFVRFNKKMRPESVIGNLRISPAVSYRAFMGRHHQLSDFDLLYLELYSSRTELPLRFNTNYTIFISKAATDVEELTMEHDFQFSFTTGRASIIGSYPESGDGTAYVESAISPPQVFFNARMDHKSLDSSAIRITPRSPVTPRIEAYENHRTGWTNVRIVGQWRDNTEYSIEVTRRAVTADGDRLENTPYRFSFRTARPIDPSAENRRR